ASWGRGDRRHLRASFAPVEGGARRAPRPRDRAGGRALLARFCAGPRRLPDRDGALRRRAHRDRERDAHRSSDDRRRVLGTLARRRRAARRSRGKPRGVGHLDLSCSPDGSVGRRARPTTTGIRKITEYRLGSAPVARTHMLDCDVVHYAWDNAIPPKLTIDAGETVVMKCRDSSDGHFRRGMTSADMKPRAVKGHPLTGPIAVRRARPGDVLQIDILELVPGDLGY